LATIDGDARERFGPFYCLRCDNETVDGAYWRGKVQRRGVGVREEQGEVVPASAAVCAACLADGFCGILLGDAFDAAQLPAVLGKTEAQAYRIHAFHIERGSRPARIDAR
jgi:hypothetical protein